MNRPALALTLLLLLVAWPAQAQAGGWTWPVGGEVVTAYRNGDDPYAAGQHRGIDVAAPVGERVVAAAAGTVTFAGVAGSSGLTVAVRAAGGDYDTSYLHLSSIAVERGQRVRAGATLGAVGTSGRRSVERPHLHFGVREAGERHAYRDPLDFLGPRPGPRSEPRRPQPGPAPAPSEPGPALGRAPGPALGRAPGPALGRAPGGAPGLPGAGPSRRPPGRRLRNGGVDLGWLAACVGLLTLAGALGRSATRPPARARPRHGGAHPERPAAAARAPAGASTA